MKRLAEIDGLRGIAILMVVFFHYINNQLQNSTNSVGKIFAKATYFGWIGVDLFFVLSGFLIGTILLSNKTSEKYFITFYIRRLLRIIPNYYLLLLIFFIIISIDFFDSSYFLTGNNVIPLWAYFFMVHNFFMTNINNLGNDSIDITWSIGIEEQFYIIFPFILYKIKNKYLPWLLSIIIFLAIVSRAQYDNWIPRYVLLNCRADSLAVGMIIAWIRLNYDIDNFTQQNKKILLILLFGVLISCGFFYTIYGDLGVFKHTLFAIIFGILVIFALGWNKNIYGKFLRNKQLMWVGSISYSLYLFHYIILGLAHFLIGNKGIIINNISDVFVTLIALISSFGFSYIIYKYLESPMIKIGKKFNY